MTRAFVRAVALATVAAAAMAGHATLAQVTLPPAELRGAGTHDVAEPLIRAANCQGRFLQGLNFLNFTDFAVFGFPPFDTRTVRPGLYLPAAGVDLDCTDGVPVTPPFGGAISTDEIQRDVETKYIGTDSGFGIAMWARLNDRFTLTGLPNPYGMWPNLQFAYAEKPVTPATIALYNANALPMGTGKPITVPMYVVPVAFAYSPVYGIRANATLEFNVKFPQKDIFGVPTGGLRLSKLAYCRIFNGLITNWNDATLQALNGGLPLFDPVDDNAARWAAEGAPIRLVGRVDRAGTTEIFTRHLATVCPPLVAANKFLQSSDALPYTPGGGSPDMSVFRADSPYFPGNPPPNFAGPVNSVGGAYYEDGTDSIIGAEALGLFILANAADGAEEAIREAVNTLKPSAIDPTLRLNGKFGYIGADWVATAPGRSLFSAALQVGGGVAFAMPNAVNAGKAVGTILPPQTTAPSGAFNINDNRDSIVTIGLKVSRAEPLDWWNVLYQDPAKTLANPATGYAVTGVSQLLTYTCFKTDANRWALANQWGAVTAKVTKTWTGAALEPTTFRGTAINKYGILTRMNIGVMPSAWLNAYNETFLKKSVQTSPAINAALFAGQVVKLGELNPQPTQLSVAGPGLWIQSKIPANATDIDGIIPNGEAVRNPTCIVGLGA